MKEKKRLILALLILLSLVIPAFYFSIELLVKWEYNSNKILIIILCILGVIAFFLPNIISKSLKLEIPPTMYFVYLFFLYGSIYLGEVSDFYYRFKNWDTLLHFISSMLLGSIGFSIVQLLNNNSKNMNLSPIFITIFAICFAITIGVVWEIYEYTTDGLLGMNMQNFALKDGTELIGRAALVDTMNDLIVDLSGATLMSVLGYLSIINESTWFKDKFQIKKIK